MSFRYYIFTWLGLLTIVVAGVLTGVESRQLGQLLVDEGDEELGFAGEAITDQVVQVLEANIRVQRAMSRTVTERLRVKAEARAGSGSDSSTPLTVADLSEEELRAILAERQVSGTTYSVYLGDATGRSLVYEPPTDASGNRLRPTDYRDRDYFQGARDTGEPFVSKVQTGRRHNVQTVYIGTPIWGRGHGFAGFIGCGLDRSMFQQITDTIAARLPGATVVLLDRDAVVVASSLGAGLDPGQDMSKVPLLAQTDPTTTTRRAGADPFGNPVRGSLTTIAKLGLGWTVAVYRPKSALDSRIDGARMKALLAAGVVLLGAIGFAFIVARRVATPISRLAGVASSMGAGQYDEAMPASSIWMPTEVAALASAIGDARQKLRANIIEREARLEELSMSNERLTASIAALGESQEKLLAGGIAHDFNNILSVILATAALLEEDLGEGRPSLSADAREIMAAAQRAAKLTRQLLAFGRRQMLRPERVDLGAVVADMKKMLLRLIPENVQLTFSDRGPAPVQVDRMQIEQVIMNLVVNARDALPQGGHVRIELGVASAAEAAELGLAASSRWLVLSIADDGTGMPESVRVRVFEPFFTTKGPDKGTGLGLATVYGIVKQSGGEITVASAPGRGTTFRVFLPMIAAADVEAEEAARAAPTPPNATILVVDDEPAIRSIAVRVLKKAGYLVVEAASAEAALMVAQTTPLDILLTDVIMPDVSGPQLAERMAALRPEAQVLFMSGYAPESSGVNLDPKHFLPKPFTPDALLARIAGLIEARTPHPARPPLVIYEGAA